MFLGNVFYVLDMGRSKENFLILFLFDFVRISVLLIRFQVLVLNKNKDGEGGIEIIEDIKIGGDLIVESLRNDKEK